jgi:hypothetical protein
MLHKEAWSLLTALHSRRTDIVLPSLGEEAKRRAAAGERRPKAFTNPALCAPSYGYASGPTLPLPASSLRASGRTNGASLP